MSGPFVVAVDGPAASGKGTLARSIARTLGFHHLDTGLLYRAVGQAVIDAGGDPADPVAAVAAARALDTDDLADPRLRGSAVAEAASVVSAVPAVRAALVDLQRAFAARPPGAVLDGRDIGTVICPDAAVKLFVDADLETRARRRWKELLATDPGTIYAAVLADLRQRDARDRQRAVAPLAPAPDAFLLDTSALTAEQALATALALIGRRPGPSTGSA
jgi:cytidylate kinase